MPNLVEVHYDQTGASKSPDKFGMRQMQQKAYEQIDARYLLLPAFGKSRAFCLAPMLRAGMHIYTNRS